MPKPPDIDPITYLIDRKFGTDDVVGEYRISLSAERLARKRPELRAEIEKYRSELESLSPDEIGALIDAEEKRVVAEAISRASAEENNRFFNRPYAAADFAHWTKMTYWKLDEAIALSLGKDPGTVSWDKVKPLELVSPLARQYGRRRELAVRAHALNQLDDPILPPSFMAWAKRMELELPEALVRGVEKTGVQVADWRSLLEQCQALAEQQSKQIKEMAEHKKEEILELKRQVEKVVAQSQNVVAERLETRERESLLKLVIGMAIRGYGYDPKAGRSPQTGQIAGDLAGLGLSMDADTVRKWLKEASDLLPQE